MEIKLGQNNRIYLYRILCVLTAVAALLPVACSYIMSGGIVTEWMGRVEELTVRPLQLFPSAETFANTGVRVNAMNSNMWFFLCGLLYRLSGNMVLTYRIYMLAVQVGTLFFSKIFFERFFCDRSTRLPAFFGMLLYMTCPYRIYVCYDHADLCMAAAWMLLPLYAWALLGLVRRDKRVWIDMVVAAISLAGVGYANVIFFLTLFGVTMLIVLCFRTVLPAVAAAAGAVFFLPGMYRLMKYLFTDAYQGLNLSVQPIMSKGYRIGQFFSTYAFREEHPGMGIGMLACLLVGLWLSFVGGSRRRGKKEHFVIGIALVFLLLSTRYFPWDVAQRMGVWAMKLVALINTPAVFCGLAWGCLCIPAAGSVERISEHENKTMAFAIPVFVLIACLGVCIYQCNMLTYSRLPLVIP